MEWRAKIRLDPDSIIKKEDNIMSIGVRLLIALVLMGILFTVIISFVEPIILRWFLVGLCVVIVLTFVNYIGNATK